MSLGHTQSYDKILSFPRVSGDEPTWGGANTMSFQFSPRERG